MLAEQVPGQVRRPPRSRLRIPRPSLRRRRRPDGSSSVLDVLNRGRSPSAAEIERHFSAAFLKVVSPEGLVQGLGQIAAARLAGHGGCSHGHTSSGKIRMIRTPPSIATNGRRRPTSIRPASTSAPQAVAISTPTTDPISSDTSNAGRNSSTNKSHTAPAAISPLQAGRDLLQPLGLLTDLSCCVAPGSSQRFEPRRHH